MNNDFTTPCLRLKNIFSRKIIMFGKWISRYPNVLKKNKDQTVNAVRKNNGLVTYFNGERY